ncbi:unnamed protein product [Gongylonema pulchrum]|uniref:Nucleoporin_N domain-containing protein n=1 Tax=Gongylonema pulchrum TaxID=637853 RepID=A0A183DE29_9BILA|nr:unnamed protein product [Gongylonema pulchrum]
MIAGTNGVQNELKDQKATITFKGSISTSISTFGAQNVNSPGLSATMFQFSPLVEHFLQSITKSQQTNANLPLLVLDSSAKTPNATDTPDLFKVFQDDKDVATGQQQQQQQQQQQPTSQPSTSAYSTHQVLSDYTQVSVNGYSILCLVHTVFVARVSADHFLTCSLWRANRILISQGEPCGVLVISTGTQKFSRLNARRVTAIL